MTKKGIGNDLILTSNFKIDLAKLLTCFSNVLPHVYKVIIALPCFKRADEPFIEAPTPYYDKQCLLKNQNNLLEPIW